MKCGIKFCGGCNPGYDRRQACEEIKEAFENKDLEFLHAVEDDPYDCLLVIGGCSNCCASYNQKSYLQSSFSDWREKALWIGKKYMKAESVQLMKL